jgi:Flp pilus assembly protein TadD
MGLPVLAVLLSGCALMSGAPQEEMTFESALQQGQIRQQQLRAAAEPVPDEPQPQTVEERLRRGDALRTDGAYAAAMWAYIQAHEQDLNRPEPIARMASLHLTVDPGRAESIFRQLTETHPGSAAAHTGLGLVLIERGDWLRARDVLARSVELDPRSAAAYSALGVSLDRLGRYADAREAYTRATALRPRYYEALNNLGVSYLSTEEFSAAEKVLQQAALAQNRDPAVFNNLGLALGRMERYDDALGAFQRAGSEQAARNNLGYVSFLNGRYERAIAEFERALLAAGDQKLLVLRNLRAAQRAEKERQASAEN